MKIKIPRKIGVIGAGTMGRGITQTFIQHGYTVTIIDKVKIILDSARDHIIYGLNKLVDLEKITSDQKRKFKKNIILSDNLEDLKYADLVIEAVNENLSLKQKILGDLNIITGDSAILATNTSTLSLDKIANSLKNPENLIGLHFFNPAEKMKLVEVIPGKETTSPIITQSINILKKIGKIPIVCKDSPGFVVNRLLLLYINEAIKMKDKKVASVNDIDEAIRSGLNHKMGPLELADLIGLDILYKLLNILSGELGERYKPTKSLKAMVESGILGKKSKRGFYNY